VNATHDPKLRSWVESANRANADFPIQNLPFGIFSRSKASENRVVGVAIGDFVLDVAASITHGIVDVGAATDSCRDPTLNRLMSLPPSDAARLRAQLSAALAAGGDHSERAQRHTKEILIPLSDVSLHLPVEIGDYTDFYASIHHATNVGSMFRPDSPLLPNYKYIPIGYHGRASSVVVTGTPIVRPQGQTKSGNAPEPSFGPSRMLDYEMELGFYVRAANPLGTPVPIDTAAEHIFGFSIVNDWSARDIQSWEYQPLGPFLSKNFATTVSPWVVTAEAAAPYRVRASARPMGDPPPLPYLSSAREAADGGLNAILETYLRTQRMQTERVSPFLVGRAPFATMYWTVAQMLTHHASNGCNLRAGDLMASGTVSGSTRDSLGSMLELTRRGAEPLTLPTGEMRTFLEDGDEVIMRAYLEAPGRPRLGFGECRGLVLPSVDQPL